ncbi:MAG: asparaginase [Candidatus Zixiibacteriota bacterium]|nr:MAG: asparaginase [candidate division Zixibacteria bacterium]
MEPAARVFRGSSVEAVHHASVAVVDGEGNLTRYLGDPDHLSVTRSSIKPFQLLPLLVVGAAEKYAFSSEQLAVMCGSHTGTDRHREVVLSNLEQAGNLPEHLQCGCHRPIWMEQEEVYPASGEDKDPVRHNCSGKHSGFLALARYLGDPLGEYINPESKAQRLVKETLAGYCEYDLKKMPYAVDGCSAPNYPLPLLNLALGFMKLANHRGETPEVVAAARCVKEAMTTHPFMVSGDKRLDYDLKRSFPGNAVSKIGAESIEGIGFSNPPLGIAVKVHDGNFRALGPVVVEVLRQLGIIGNIDDFPLLRPYERPDVRNSRGIVTGQVVAEFMLKKG